MKKIFLLLGAIYFSSLALQSCSTQTYKVVVNREVTTEKDGKMLLGQQLKEQFQKDPYKDWYEKEKSEYAVDQKSIDELRKLGINNYNLTIFLGTWCEDSHREVPRLMKILETLKYPDHRLTLIAVNRKKESPNGEEGLHNIQKVPTIIVSRYGKEIGRIIEIPKSGWLERDLVEIVKKYNPSIKELFKKDDKK